MYQLRELSRKDIPEINKWRNDRAIIHCLGAPYRYINQEVDERWYDNYMANRNNSVRCAIVSENDDNIIGLISLVGIDFLNQSAELHIMIGNSDNQGKGAGTYAVKQMLSHAFHNMNLHRIQIKVLDDNKRAIHLYEKVGFVCEGISRESRFKEGKFVNMVNYSILREEFEKNIHNQNS